MEKSLLKKGFLIKNTTIITVMRLFGTVTGFILDAVILALLGLGLQTDAFFIASTIPFLITSVMREQVTVLQPIFVRTRTLNGVDESWRTLPKFNTRVQYSGGITPGR